MKLSRKDAGHFIVATLEVAKDIPIIGVGVKIILAFMHERNDAETQSKLDGIAEPIHKLKELIHKLIELIHKLIETIYMVTNSERKESERRSQPPDHIMGGGEAAGPLNDGEREPGRGACVRPELDLIVVPGDSIAPERSVETSQKIYVTRYMITAQQYRAFLSSGDYTDDRHWVSKIGCLQNEHWRSEKFKLLQDCSDYSVPITVNYWEALAYARWMRMDVPTFMEAQAVEKMLVTDRPDGYPSALPSYRRVDQWTSTRTLVGSEPGSIRCRILRANDPLEQSERGETVIALARRLAFRLITTKGESCASPE